MIIIVLKDISPGRFLALGYIIVILIGTILLLIPLAAMPGKETSIVEAFFTATSATAVTGLIVVNTAEHWTIYGQIVIMLLIQIGGLGFMTSTTLLFFIFRRRLSLKERLLIMEDLNYNKISGAISLTRYIIKLTFIIEGIGGLLLFIFFKQSMTLPKAIYFALFHAISAFNNAGFDLLGNSLENYVSSIYISMVIAILIILGGLGFIVIEEIYHKLLYNKRISLHSRIAILVSLILIIFGTLAVFVIEYDNHQTLGNLSLKGKLVASFFQGVTPRTAGFNTVPIGQLKHVTLFLIIILMFIGASPGSTGGGIKTTTIGTLLIVVYNMAVGKEDIEIFGRRLKQKDIYKALTVIMTSLLVIALVIMILSVTEEASFINIIFEVFSAFGTVGLSTGITPSLTVIGRLFIIITMFIGRVGPFTLALALGKKLNNSYRYPEEDILIG